MLITVFSLIFAISMTLDSSSGVGTLSLNLTFLEELFETGKVMPVIDRRYPLSEVPEALRYLEEGHHQGKLVITMDHNNKT